MRIAIPVAQGRLAMHFGHCEQFSLIDTEPDTKAILSQETINAPDHVPGLLPRWLAQRGVNVVIAGGMGARALGLFNEQGIKVIIGAPAEGPETLVQYFLNGNLQSGANVCDH